MGTAPSHSARPHSPLSRPASHHLLLAQATGCQQTDSVCPSARLFGVRNLLIVTLTPLGVSLPTWGQHSASAAVGSEHGGWAETPDTHQRTQTHIHHHDTWTHTPHMCTARIGVSAAVFAGHLGDSSFHYCE